MTPSSSLPVSNVLAEADVASSGFQSKEQMRQARELIELCSGFTGLGPLLAGREPKAAQISFIEFEPGYVIFPHASLRDLQAGVAGRLGLALMGAASKMARPSAPSFNQASRMALSHPSASDDARADADDLWDGWSGIDEDMESQPRRTSGPASQRKPTTIEEGVGADSLNSIITALEDSGFGNPATAELIRANRAKASKRKGP
jgi:hypothetical protein